MASMASVGHGAPARGRMITKAPKARWTRLLQRAAAFLVGFPAFSTDASANRSAHPSFAGSNTRILPATLVVREAGLKPQFLAMWQSAAHGRFSTRLGVHRHLWGIAPISGF